jgi:hypothetical protein
MFNLENCNSQKAMFNLENCNYPEKYYLCKSLQKTELCEPCLPTNKLKKDVCSRKRPGNVAKLLLKGTVRPDWICMRVVSLESPLKAHQPL